ncbi:hypothetical protein [Nitratireductor indicus]|uniref:hypothetical protein n=1 Tax=Nitratireductor indicus TaxID=721133 RepID=UPI0028745FB0|nr:hypothetical protein [Nitratireductor indicus]MDS1138616.1 hypothetical protein [Nitratireductor indicus]
MNNDLKERLRDPHIWRRDTLEYITPLAKNAADRIEQLESEIERLRDEIKGWRNDRYFSKFMRFQARALTAEARLSEALARIEQLEADLEKALHHLGNALRISMRNEGADELDDAADFLASTLKEISR